MSNCTRCGRACPRDEWIPGTARSLRRPPPAPAPLFEQLATLGSGPNFEAVVTIAGPRGTRVVLFQGELRYAQRLLHAWNAQFGVPTDEIRPALGDED